MVIELKFANEGMYTNYEPTPTPVPPGNTFKKYQDKERSTLGEHIEKNEFVPFFNLDVPHATIRNLGVTRIAPMVPVSDKVAPIAINVWASRRACFGYFGGNGGDEIHGIDGGATGASVGTRTVHQDADGCGANFTGTEAINSEVKVNTRTWTAGNLQGRWGWYCRSRFKLSTVMTSLTDRAFGGPGVHDDVATGWEDEIVAANTGAATTYNFVLVRWKSGTTSANWTVRVGNGTTSIDALDTLVPVVTGTLYDIELWAEPPTPTYFIRINGGDPKPIISTLLPSNTNNIDGAGGWYGRNIAAVTGTGNLAIQGYTWGIVMP